MTTAHRAEGPPETARQEEGRPEGHPGTQILGDPGCLGDRTARLEDRPAEDRPEEDRPGEDRPEEDRPGENRPEEDHREAARSVTTDDL